MNLCGRLAAEWRLSMFSIDEVNSKTLDVKETFNPTPKILVVIEKLIIIGATIYAIYLSILQVGSIFWLAYLTYIGSLISMAYFLCSLTSILTVGERNQNELTTFDKFIWGFFAASAFLEFFISTQYWLLVYGPESILDYDTIYLHGILFLLLLFDWFAVHRFPVRLKQIFIILPLYVAYLVWTLIHAQTDIGNPEHNDNDPETDDDAIYKSINWNKRPQKTLVLSVMTLIVIIPTLFFTLWVISLLIPKHYIDEENNKDIEIKNLVNKKKLMTKELV